MPATVCAVAMEPAAQVIVNTSLSHSRERMLDDLQQLAIPRGFVEVKHEFQTRNIRET